MSVVRPEFGPTLPEILRPRLERLPRGIRPVLTAIVAVLVIVVAGALLVRGGNGASTVVVRSPIAFNYIYQSPFTKRQPAAGEMSRVGGDGQTFAVRTLQLPAYRGDSAGFLPVYASRLATAMAREYPGFVLRAEGRANVNKIQGYELVFQARVGGKLTFGRRILLLPQTTDRQGVDILMLATRTVAIPRADAVGRNGPLKTSLRSFRFGTERP